MGHLPATFDDDDDYNGADKELSEKNVTLIGVSFNARGAPYECMAPNPQDMMADRAFGMHPPTYASAP